MSDDFYIRYESILGPRKQGPELFDLDIFGVTEQESNEFQSVEKVIPETTGADGYEHQPLPSFSSIREIHRDQQNIQSSHTHKPQPTGQSFTYDSHQTVEHMPVHQQHDCPHQTHTYNECMSTGGQYIPAYNMSAIVPAVNHWCHFWQNERLKLSVKAKSIIHNLFNEMNQDQFNQQFSRIGTNSQNYTDSQHTVEHILVHQQHDYDHQTHTYSQQPAMPYSPAIQGNGSQVHNNLTPNKSASVAAADRSSGQSVPQRSKKKAKKSANPAVRKNGPKKGDKKLIDAQIKEEIELYIRIEIIDDIYTKTVERDRYLRRLTPDGLVEYNRFLNKSIENDLKPLGFTYESFDQHVSILVNTKVSPLGDKK